jgi:hypothetical protein
MADRDDDGYSNSCGTNPNDIAMKQERTISKLCTHCQLNPTVFLYRRDSLCFACLEIIWVRKTKTNLFKSRPARSEIMSAVFGFTGSVASVVLLDVLNDALSTDRSQLRIVHIDTSAVLPKNHSWTSQDNQTYHDTLKRLVNDKYHDRWPLDIVKLEEELNMSAEEVFLLLDRVSDDKTSQEDVLSYLVRSALIRYAKRHNIHRIVTAENASTLSVKAISSCAKGRGFQIAEECSLVETMNDIDMIFVAPMRENLVDREVAYYFWKKNLECALGPRLVPYPLADSKSINGLTRAFLMSLQRGFDHSMHTVLRSTEKLTSVVHSSRSLHASSSTSASSLASSSSSEPNQGHGHRCTFCTRLLSAGERDHPALLCFSCNNMLFKSSASQNAVASEALTLFLNSQRQHTLVPGDARLPTEKPLKERGSRKAKVSTRKELKQQIQEFLIEEPAEADLGAFIPEDDAS